MLYCVFYEFKKVFLRYTLSYFALLVYILTIGKHVLFARFLLSLSLLSIIIIVTITYQVLYEYVHT